MIFIFVLIYIASAMIVGAVHWAQYQDDKKAGYDISMQDKVLKLYIVPLIPIFNTMVAFHILAGDGIF